MNDDRAEKEKPRVDAEPENSGGRPEQAAELEKELDSYPLREKADDPRWAVRTVKIWIGFALASLIFILTLLVLGAMYD